MKNEEITYINPKELKVGENSRIRAEKNVAELMESIKQNGILQPIVARTEDKLIICGNRRLMASIKLGLEYVPVRFISNISDKQMLILNLTENIQRNDISSIEIGRICDYMLKSSKFKISMNEIAIALGVNGTRVKACVNAFIKLPEKFRDKVVHVDNARSRKTGDLPEQVVMTILNFTQEFKKLTDAQAEKLLEATMEKSLSISQIRLIGKLYTTGMPFDKALKEVDAYIILRCDLVALKTEMEAVKKKEGVSGKRELIQKLVNKAYPNLLY